MRIITVRMRRLRGGRRTGAPWAPTAWLVLFALTVSSITTAGAAFVGSTANAGNLFTAGNTFPTYPAAVQADNPLFHYRFDEAAGATTAADASGNGRRGVYGLDHANGTVQHVPFDDGSGSVAKDLSGAATPKDLTLTGVGWAPGKAGTAGVFNGTSSYGVTSGPVLDTSASFSVAAWVSLDATGDYRTAVSQSGTNHSAFYLQYHAGNNRWAFTMTTSNSDVSGNLVQSLGAPATNTWTHLVGTYNAVNREMKLYVDGVLQNTVVKAVVAWNATSDLDVGSARYAGNRVDWWKGGIDDVRVTSGVLDQARINELADGTTAGPATYWPLDDTAGSTLTRDMSGNSNTGSPGSAAAFAAGRYGNGLSLDGTTNGHLDGQISAADSTSDFSVSAWVYLTDKTTTRTVVSQGGATGAGWSLRYNSGTDRWQFTATRTEGGTVDTATPAVATAVANTWVQLIGVFTAGTLNLYVDGALAGTAAHGTTWDATGPLQLGRARDGSGGWTNHLKGVVDDVRVWRRALSPWEAGRVYSGVNARAFGHLALGQPGALQGAQQGERASTSLSHSNAGNSYQPIRYTNPTTFSLECWFRGGGAVGGNLVTFGNGTMANSGVYDRKLQITDDGRFVFGTNSGTTNTVQSAAGHLDGNWHHVAVSVSPATGTALYVDGVRVASTGYVAPGNYTGYWRWGGETHNASWPSPDYLTGRLDELAVYATALTAQQVSTHYYANH